MPKHNETTLIVFDYIKDFIANRQIAPTIREIGEGCFLGHTSVYRHLDKLEGWGWIEREPGQARSIRIMKERVGTPEKKNSA